MRFTFGLIALFIAQACVAQSWPAKPVRLVVPFPAGGGVDTTARSVAHKLSEAMGQTWVIENRGGAGGNIGADNIAKSAPDGYSLLITTTGHAIAPSLYRRLPFDVEKDFTPITQLVATFLVLVVPPAMPATVKELVALAKASPGKLNYAHTGLGVAPHLVAEMFRLAAGINIVAVPYKGDAPIFPALMTNEVQLAFLPPATSAPQVKAGKIRALAVTGNRRNSAFPGVPTIAEAGEPGATYEGWVAFFGPAGLPRDIVAKIASESARAVKAPDIQDKLGGDPAGTTPEEFAAKFRSEVANYAKVIKEANVPLQD
jgi:tripartite-type tricarboxylate transporter receptor subunit TctC